jgi:hypothetical protein
LFALAPPALLLGLPATELTLTLAPGLFFALPPLVALLIRQSRLLTPLTILTVNRRALLSTIATLVDAVVLSTPLARLTVLLGLLRSSLLFRYATLLINLSPLLLGPQLILSAQALCPTLLIGNPPLLVELTLLIQTPAILLRLILPLLFSNASLLFALSPLQFVTLTLLVLRLPLLLLTLLLLTLTRGPLLFVVLALLVLRLPLLLLTLLLLTLACGCPLLFVSLPALLVLRLSLVVAALGFGLLALLIVLRLSGLLVPPLLPFCALLSPVLAVL